MLGKVLYAIVTECRLAGLAFMFSSSILLQILDFCHNRSMGLLGEELSRYWIDTVISPFQSLCFIQQLVANVICAHVCSDTHAMSFLWRWFDTVLDKQRRWRIPSFGSDYLDIVSLFLKLDQCCQVFDWGFSRGEHSDSSNFKACQLDRDRGYANRVHVVLHPRLHNSLFPSSNSRGRLVNAIA
ncbi:hypothetical protein ZIOFF_026662 [Zingiber officinale]|uniref:Uncharacterized protein n=1 Tax=Zingiber officinale TaxID=94328 RepID=A0A8J5H552_ZINOF|nr:hypothetical protein ZIOFF_026662 [Zingiber officinale]